jgi:hypothetical protein
MVPKKRAALTRFHYGQSRRAEEILSFTHISQHCMDKLECNLFHSCGYNSTVYINYFSLRINLISV